ncbi:MAG: hypothetical protein DRZ82_05675 [Thermoprotei archaeon]|nr:MAG: hypothetical protein DRZ82_05675 [Thermoprotei archaeon]
MLRPSNNDPPNYEIGRYVYSPNNDVYGLYLVIRPDMLETPGVLAEIFKLFAKYEVSILHFKLSRPELKKPIRALLFFKVNGQEVAIQQIVEELRKLEYIIEVKLIEPVFKGLVVDTVMFPPTIMGERVVIFRQALLDTFVRHIRERYGSGFEAMLYYLGLDLGKSAFTSHIKYMSGDKEKALRFGEMLFRLMGFGILKIVKIDWKTGDVIVRLYDCFECRCFKNSNSPKSQLIRGMLTGWLEGILGFKLSSEETACVARGDPYCEIRFRRAKD